MNILEFVPNEAKQKRFVKECLNEKFKQHEQAANTVDIPYFIKAQKHFDLIMESGKLEAAYKAFRKQVRCA